ncbi:MAG TPA: hypothetical protein VFW83_07855, partial [Bryobacteraceae bacterium]|nr:hypothetical protein [Bryobacteraceae bacterium]
SSLSLGSASINIVKTNAGPWNFQYLLDGAAAGHAGFPSIRMRGGRVDFKFGDTQSVFFFNDADLNIDPSADGSVDLRFGGSPSRTDRSAPDFGNFFVRGTWRPGNSPRLDLNVELERSSLDEVSRLIDPRGFGLHGIVAFQAQIAGPPSQAKIAGQVQIGDVHRWDLLPQGGGWKIPVKGDLDLPGGKLDLASAEVSPEAPLALEFHASNFLAAPRWEASARLNQVPLEALIESAQHLGAAFPENLTAAGGVSGEIGYSEEGGLSGSVEVSGASFTLPDTRPVKARSAAVDIGGGEVRLEPSAVEVGTKEESVVEGSYRFGAARGLDLRISTRGLNVADLPSFGFGSIPLLDRMSRGIWRGWARYRDGEWSGDYVLQDAKIDVDGLADPLRIQSASVKLNGERVAVTKLRAKAGKIAFSGDYHWEPRALRPDRFDLTIPEADVAELERLFAPSLARERGFFARTLRLRPDPAPAWLTARRAGGTVSIGDLKAGDADFQLDRTRILWDGTVIRLVALSGAVGQAAIAGNLEIGLENRAPHFHFDGTLWNLPYKDGGLDFEGSASADGFGDGFWETAHAEGSLKGRSIAFAPDADFRSAEACFSVRASEGGFKWKLSDVGVLAGDDMYFGSGATGPDGELVLDLTGPGRQVRYAAALVAEAP